MAAGEGDSSSTHDGPGLLGPILCQEPCPRQPSQHQGGWRSWVIPIRWIGGLRLGQGAQVCLRGLVPETMLGAMGEVIGL